MINSSFQLDTPRQFGLLTGHRLPARLDAKLTSQVLGFQEHDIPVLVNRKLLEPLGEPADNAKKHFAWVDIMALAEDRSWLAKATRILYRHWQDKNASRKGYADASESSHSE